MARDWADWASTWGDIIAKVDQITGGNNLASCPLAVMWEDGIWHIDVQVKTTSGEFDVSAVGADLAEAARGAYLRLGNYQLLWRRLD